MAGLFAVGESYLRFQTAIENGGVAGVVLNSIDFNNGAINTNKIQNFAMWTSYAKGFLFNVSRMKPMLTNGKYQLNNFTAVSNPNYGSTVAMILWLVTFFVLTCALSVVMVRQCVFDKRDRKEAKRFKCKRTRRIHGSQSYQRKRKLIIISFTSLLIILWLIFMVLLCVLQYLFGTKFTNNAGSTNQTAISKSSSIRDAVSTSFMHLNNFVNVLTNETSVFLKLSLDTISSNARNQLRVSIGAFANEVLKSFNITRLFNTAALLIDSINEVVTSMTYINDNCQTTLIEVDNLKGSVNVYQSNINNYLTNICTSLSDPSLRMRCQDLQQRNRQFQVDIQTSSVSSRSSVIMIFVLQQYNLNISSITTPFHQVNSDFQLQLGSLLNSTIEQFDVSSSLSIVTTTWDSAVAQIRPSVGNMSSYNATVLSYVASAASYVNLFIIIIVLLLIMTVLVLLFSFRDSIRHRFLNRCLSFFIQSMFILILTVSATVCVTILIVANFSQSEICNQINTTSGVIVLDQLIDVRLADPWTVVASSIRSLSPDIEIILTQPTNVLSGIKSRCRNASMGLLTVMGMGSLVNITQIFQSQSITSVVATAQSDSLKAFLDVNPQQMIPTDIISFVGQTATLITYFDSINYNTSIKELQKPLVGISNYVGFFNDLSSFTMNSSAAIGWTSDLKYLNQTVNQLLSIVPNLTNIERNVGNLSLNFQILQNHRNNTELLNQLISTITSVQNLFNKTSLVTSMFSSIYRKRISEDLISTMQQLFTDAINGIIYRIFPCTHLADMFWTLSSLLCASSDVNVALASLGIILLVTVVTCQSICLIVMISISLRLT